jgi:predicted Zn-dependent protease
LVEKEPAAAIDKFNEVLKLEPGHQKVKLELARAHLAKGDCGQVAEITKEALFENPYQSDFFLLRIQSKVCTNSIEDFDAELMNPFVEKEDIAIYLETSQAQFLIANEKYSSAIEILNRAKARDTEFPEVYYWLANVKTKLNQSPEVELQKYVNLCKEQSGKIKAKYFREPRTCRELNTLQQQLEAIRTEAAG